MRVNASLKSIINGVTTLKDQMATPGFAKEQVNFRGDPIRGLTRRPPLEHIVNMSDTEDGDIILDVSIEDVKYWVILKPRLIDTDIQLVLEMYDLAGNQQVTQVTSEGAEYLRDLANETELAHTVVGETVVLVNKTTIVLKDDELSDGNRTSMILCKTSVTSSDTAEFQLYDGVGGAILSITHNFTGSGDISTHDMATQLATAINTAASTVEAVAQQSVVLLNTSADGSDNEFVDVVIIDNATGAIVGMNGFINDIADLPGSTNDDEVMEIRPLTTTGDQVEGTSYYLRGEVITPLSPADPGLNITDTEESAPADAFSYKWRSYGASTIALDFGAGNGTIANTFGGTVNGSITHNAVTYNLKAIIQNVRNFKPANNNKWYGSISCFFDQHDSQIFNNISLRKVSTNELVFSEAVNFFSADSTAAPGYTEYAYDSGFLDITRLEVGEDYILELNPPADFDGTKYTRWTETVRLDEQYKLQPSTMPVVIRPEDGVFTLRQPLDEDQDIAWGARTAGDSVSAPFPSFVGKTITDVAAIQNRLSFISNDKWIASRSNNLFSFWRTTALSTVAIDYIDIGSTANSNIPFTSMTAHNRDILLFSGRGQFKIDGTIPIDPRTIALPRVSTYEHHPTAKPISTGVDVYFSTTYGASSGLSRFVVDNQRDRIDTAHSVTDHVLGYIPGDIRQLEGTHTLNTLFVRTDSDAEIFVYEFNDEGTRRAWSKWIIDEPNVEIVGMLIDHPKIYLAVRDTVSKDTHMLVANIQNTAGPESTFDVYLDYRQVHTGVNLSVDVSANNPDIGSNAIIVQGAGCPAEGDIVTYTLGEGGTYNLDTDMEGGTVIIGRPYESVYVPQSVRIRDEGGYVQNRVRERILSWLLSVVDTGYLTADVICDSVPNYPDYPTQIFTGLIANEQAQTDLQVVTDALFNVSFKQDPTLCDLRISSDHYTGATINQIEWLGNYTNRGRRF